MTELPIRRIPRRQLALDKNMTTRTMRMRLLLALLPVTLMVLFRLTCVLGKQPECSDRNEGITPSPGEKCGWKLYPSSLHDPVHMGQCVGCHGLCGRDLVECQKSCKVYYERCVAPPTLKPTDDGPGSMAVTNLIDTEHSTVSALNEADGLGDGALAAVIIGGLAVVAVGIVIVIVKRKWIIERVRGTPPLHHPVPETDGSAEDAKNSPQHLLSL